MNAIPRIAVRPVLLLGQPCEVQVESGPFLEWIAGRIVARTFDGQFYDVQDKIGNVAINVPAAKVRQV